MEGMERVGSIHQEKRTDWTMSVDPSSREKRDGMKEVRHSSLHLLISIEQIDFHINKKEHNQSVY